MLLHLNWELSYDDANFVVTDNLFVILTTSGGAIDNQVGVMTTLDFQCLRRRCANSLLVAYFNSAAVMSAWHFTVASKFSMGFSQM